MIEVIKAAIVGILIVLAALFGSLEFHQWWHKAMLHLVFQLSLQRLHFFHLGRIIHFVIIHLHVFQLIEIMIGMHTLIILNQSQRMFLQSYSLSEFVQTVLDFSRMGQSATHMTIVGEILVVDFHRLIAVLLGIRQIINTRIIE